jgi:energy-converting hydrogenase Eha subunit A
MTYDDAPEDPIIYDDQETEVIDDDIPSDDENMLENYEQRYRGSNDPLFGLLIAGAVSVGLMPLANTDADLRYTLTWGLLAGFGVLAWLIGNFPRITEEKPENLAWGLAFGLILGIPVLAFGSGALDDISMRIFPDLKPGTVLALLVFIMPMGETLFFRGILQETRTFWEVAIIATIWNLVLFFPLINAGPYPLIMGVILAMVNTSYGYVRDRNGLAAAWIAQITTNIILLFFTFI